MPSLEDLSVDQLLAETRRLQGSDALLKTLLSDPTSREAAQRALKKANPTLSIPELDAVEKVRAEMEPDRKRLAELEKELIEQRTKDRLERSRSDIKTKYKLTDADVAEVEKLMVAEVDPIPSYDAAARVFVASKRDATPTPAVLMPPTYSMPESEVWGKGIGNKAALDKAAINEAYAAFNDIRQGKVAGLGPATIQ